MKLDPLLYDVQFDSETGEMSFYDKAGGLIYSCVLEREEIEDDISKPLMFKAAANNSSVALSRVGNVTNTYETSRDGVTWETYELTTSGVVVPLNRGEEIYFRCSNWSDTFSLQLDVRFKMSGKIKAYHNCASMLGAEMPKTPPTWGFGLLFFQCASLVKAPLLGVSAYADWCFRSMFSGTRIVYPPTLPRNTAKESCCEYMFSTCKSLVEAPELRAILDDDYGARCYASMFYNCTSLKVAPELPASGALPSGCYWSMFEGCSNLTTPPSTLPGKISYKSTNAYRAMFSGCKSLTKAPSFGEWQDTETGLCAYMFSGCSSLVEPPVLPRNLYSRARTSAFEGMFKNCTSLVHPPELPYIDTFENCYKSMFEGCTSLVEAPDLFDISIATDSCDRMFYGCSSLSRVVCRAKSGLSNAASWLSGVSPTGEFYADPSASWSTGASGIPEGWTRKSVDELVEDPNIQDDPSKPLMFYSSKTGSSISYTKNGGDDITNPDLEYSDDGNVWEPFPTDLTLVLDKGQSVYVRTSSDTYAPVFEPGNSTHKQFNIKGIVFAYHNVHSVLKKEFSSVQSPMLYELFFDCFGLFKAPLLPATTLCDNSYDTTFLGCLSLTIPPVLPATTLADFCYVGMFNTCVSLKEAPALPATTLAGSCYASMFENCVRLTQAPTLPATTLANSCYASMFEDCDSLTLAPALPATTLANSCYARMFAACASLTQTPTLPATTLAESCYSNMFVACEKLSRVRCYATDRSATKCTDNWLWRVSETGSFHKRASASWSTGVSGIPSGWTVYNVA